MAWKRFAIIRDGIVVHLIESQSGEVVGFIDVTDVDGAVLGADFDADTETYSEPSADLRLIVKALVLIIKDNADKITIPPAALEIWQRVKEDRL